MTDINWCRDNPEEAAKHIDQLESKIARAIEYVNDHKGIPMTTAALLKILEAKP